eukprot:11189061-Lingulodinium_polyedra.AAC.1
MPILRLRARRGPKPFSVLAAAARPQTTGDVEGPEGEVPTPEHLAKPGVPNAFKGLLLVGQNHSKAV